MLSTQLTDIPGLWKRLLIDLTFARNYPVGFIDLPGPAAKNPVLEQILPSLLHIKAVAILDHSLRAWLDANGMIVPKKPYGMDLKGRIDYLADQGKIIDRQPLHDLRGVRNDLAHEPAEVITWTDLDRDIASINTVLKELGLVGELPQLEIYAERSGAQESPDPKVNCVFHYQIAVKEANTVIADIKWSKSLLNDDA